MTEFEVKIWASVLTIKVYSVNDSTFVVEETHTGEVPSRHCAKVVVCLGLRPEATSEPKTIAWTNRTGRMRVGKFDSYLEGRRMAEDKFVQLLGAHLSKEFERDKLSRGTWYHIRRKVREGLTELMPKEELDKELKGKRKIELFRRLYRAKWWANHWGFTDVGSELERLIEGLKI